VDKNYLIKGIDQGLYSKFKTACAYYNLSIKNVLIKHMQKTVDDHMNVMINSTFAAQQRRKGGKR